MTDKRKLNIVAGIAIVCFVLLVGLAGVSIMLEISIIPEEYERIASMDICLLAIGAIWIVRGWK